MGHFAIQSLALLLLLHVPIGAFVASLMNLRLKRGKPALNVSGAILTAPIAVTTVFGLLLAFAGQSGGEFSRNLSAIIFLSALPGLVGLVIYLFGFFKNRMRFSSPEKVGLSIALVLLVLGLVTFAVHTT